MWKTASRNLIAMMIGLILSGCGQNPPAKSNTEPAPVPGSGAASAPATGSTAKLTPTGETPGKDAKPATPTAPSTTSNTVAAGSYPHASYLTDDVVGILVAHPRRLTEMPLYTNARAAGMLKDMEREFSVLKPEEIELVTMLIDQPSINTTADKAGLQVVAAETNQTAEVVTARTIKQNLKMLGLAFHNYLDVNRHFPRHDGDGPGMFTGLSWRVHLLPYLEQADLYNQFKLDEPWDSEHNKKLIEKMPRIYQSAGVTDNGKTAVHVFTGDGSLFHGDKGPIFREITDGSSNTILAVAAGSDTAEIWTKPGGLPLDEKMPKKNLGKLSGKTFTVLMCDGSVMSLKTSVDDSVLTMMIKPADGMFVNIYDSVVFNDEPQDTPTLIVTLVHPADRTKILGTLLSGMEDETFEGQTIHKDTASAAWFADDQTYVFGPLTVIRKIISAKTSGKAGNPAILKQLALQADIAMAFDVGSQSALIAQIVEKNPIPGIGLVQNLKSIAVQYNLTGKPGDKLMEVLATTEDAQGASMISDILKGFLAQGKLMFKQIPVPPTQTAGEKELLKFAQGVVDSAALSQTDNQVQLLVPVPAGIEKLPELMKPAFDQARAAAEATKRRNTMKQFGLAFHNYHDVWLKFPGAGSSADGKKGLSWRVHLLPYLDQANLYNQFKMDEPWDSPHNKALIDQMPDIFKSEGVTEPNKTSYHVFTGPGSLFADDRAPGINMVTDGTSNTILAVEAGPDTAEIWTKPGGLDFDPKDPVKGLGKVVGDTFLILLCDGTVRFLPKTIPPTTLRKLIQCADGEVVDF